MTTGAPSAFPPVRRSVALHFMDVLPAGACAVLPTLIQSRTPQVQSDQPYSQEGDLYPTAGIRRCSKQRGPRALCRGDVRRPRSLLGRSRAIRYRGCGEWRGRDEQWEPRRKDLTAHMIAAPLSRGPFSFLVNRFDAVSGPGRFTSPTCTARRCRRQPAGAARGFTRAGPSTADAPRQDRIPWRTSWSAILVGCSYTRSGR